MKLPSLPLDVYILYGFVGVICSLLISVILNRTKATAFRNTIDQVLCNVLRFFIIFCLFDAIWGIVGAFTATHPQKVFIIIYTISSYIFHLLALLSSFAISVYSTHYLKPKTKMNTFIWVMRIIIIVIQLTLLIQNIWTGTFFIVDENGAYHAGFLRAPAFLLQFLQYFPFCIYSIYKGIHYKKINKKVKYSHYFQGAFFIFLPFLFGVLQMFYPDGPFYSFGFAVFAVSIYAISVTKQREDYLADYHRIEEEKKSRESIEKALNAAKEANEAKSLFLANMSHDIRTPINGIMGLTTLAEKEDDVEKLHDYLKRIDSTSNHLLSLVNDVLDMSRIESKHEALIEEEIIDIRTIVDNCYSIIASQLFQRPVKLEVKYTNEISHPYVYGDELRIKQILINILGNAIKFTSEGGVTLTITEGSVVDNIAMFTFIVSDTGIGMSKEFMDHIFEPFSQEHNNGRSKYVGTGLGMSITKELVDLMKGTIDVNSELNKGSTFKVSLPFRISDKEAVKEINFEENKDFTLDGIKIMLVEDNELNMEIAKTILESNNAIVTCCENGEVALETFKTNKPGTFDVILMDIMMPVMDGYKATVGIRSLIREDGKTIPIIAMTANAFDEDKKKATLSGMNGHVSKPINFEILFNEIRKQLTKKNEK